MFRLLDVERGEKKSLKKKDKREKLWSATFQP
jgi:hypothetical protein